MDRVWMLRHGAFSPVSAEKQGGTPPRFTLWGVVNVTPDSFFDGGRYCEKNAVLQRAKQIIEEGADIIDIGGYSSRPNAEHISVEEEKRRLAPNIELLLKNPSRNKFY